MADIILVATDFSETSAGAVDIAAALAKQTKAIIHLLHVFEPPSITVPELALEPRIEQALRERADAQLSTAAASLRSQGVSVEEYLIVGAPIVQVIAEVAATRNPALVVLGSHGRRPLPRLLMGSVAEGALLNIKQPVLVVPARASATSRPLPPPGRRWRIAVGVDFSNSARAAVDWVRDLRRRIDFDVVFIHLYWPAAEYARFGLTGPRDLFQPDPATVELLSKSLTSVIGPLPGQGEATMRILPNWGSPGERLVDEAREGVADLLVLGTHHRHGLSRLLHGSTVPPALHAAALPILCVSRSPRPQLAKPLPALRNILAATDLSEFGNRAVAHAFALARGDHGVVHLLYVNEHVMPSPVYAYAPQSAQALAPDELNELRAKLHALIPAEAAGLGITTEVIVVDGGAAPEVICQTAERLDADAICLGSHGRAGLGKLALGSVAAHVVHKAARPVLVVRGQPD